MTLPSGLRMAWTTDTTGSVAPGDGVKRKIPLPFTVATGNALSVISSQSGVGEDMADSFTKLITKVQATATHAIILAWNDGAIRLESLVSILIVERKNY